MPKPRRTWFTTAATAVAVVLATSWAARAAGRPNVLFIIADDMCFDTVRAFGVNSEVETPNLDRLAECGTTFTHAYNMGGWHGAVCVASRTMLNTGRFLWHAKAAEPALKSKWVPEKRMWSQLMAAAGYDTWFSGKWHVQADPPSIFGTARHVRGGMPRQTPAGYDRPKADGTDPWDPSDPKFGGFWEGGKHWSEVLGDDGVDFLETAAADDDPFFIYLAFNAPHDPRQSPREYVDRYPVDEIAVPANFVPEYPFAEAMKSGRGLRDEKLAPFPRTEHAVRVNRREYYAIITHMDAQIGRIFEALEKSGKADETVIVFTADHGLACGYHGLMGKQNMFDHSVRVPFMISGPDIAGGRRIDTPIYLQDVMPTALELAGAEIPEWVEFKSLLPLLESESEAPSAATHHGESVYGAYIDSQRMITRGNHKLILYPAAKKALLFDLAADPLERHDLLGDSNDAALAIARNLFGELLRLQHETGDTLDLAATYPDLR